MGKQYNKVEKRRRRLGHVKRKKAAARNRKVSKPTKSPAPVAPA
jgi:hypothetical protein